MHLLFTFVRFIPVIKVETAGNEVVLHIIQHVPDNACFVATVCSLEDVIVIPIRLGVAVAIELDLVSFLYFFTDC